MTILSCHDRLTLYELSDYIFNIHEGKIVKQYEVQDGKKKVG